MTLNFLWGIETVVLEWTNLLQWLWKFLMELWCKRYVNWNLLTNWRRTAGWKVLLSLYHRWLIYSDTCVHLIGLYLVKNVKNRSKSSYHLNQIKSIKKGNMIQLVYFRKCCTWIISQCPQINHTNDINRVVRRLYVSRWEFRINNLRDSFLKVNFKWNFVYAKLNIRSVCRSKPPAKVLITWISVISEGCGW